MIFIVKYFFKQSQYRNFWKIARLYERVFEQFSEPGLMEKSATLDTIG